MIPFLVSKNQLKDLPAEEISLQCNSAKQSGKNWDDFPATVLREYGLHWASSDHYIGAIAALYLALHVDGLAIAVLKHLTGTTFITSNFKIHDLGELSYLQGIQIVLFVILIWVLHRLGQLY